MKRQGGTIYNYFKRNRSGSEQISSPGSPHPGTSQESQAESSLSSSPGLNIQKQSHVQLFEIIFNIISDVQFSHFKLCLTSFWMLVKVVCLFLDNGCILF